MDKRVVITGMGVISPIGNDVDSFWKSLVAGVCGIDSITEFPVDDLEVKIGGKVKDFNPEAFGMDKPFARKQDKFTLYAMAAAWQAMQDSGLQTDGEGQNIDPFDLGVYIGSGIGGFDTIYREVGKMIEDESGRWISPLFVPTMISNIAAGQVAIKHKAQGACLNIATACATSTHTIGEAYRAVRHGYAQAVIAGGTDHCTIPIGLASFANCKALTKEPDPKHASLPFNADRGGFVMADGAGILILEEYEHAKARGAKIYAEIVGYGNTCDAYHSTAPRPDGSTQARCITEALEQAGFDETRDKVYINAHGTGTRLNDLSETNAYKIAFGDFAYKCHISSTKSMHGPLLGATGAVGQEMLNDLAEYDIPINELRPLASARSAGSTIKALNEGIVPPTINFDHPDPECDLDYTPNHAVRAELTLGLSDSFGFGGHDACLAFRNI